MQINASRRQNDPPQRVIVGALTSIVFLSICWLSLRASAGGTAAATGGAAATTAMTWAITAVTTLVATAIVVMVVVMVAPAEPRPRTTTIVITSKG